MKRLVCGILALCLLLGLLPALADTHPTNWYEVFVYSFSDSDGDGIGDFKGLLSKLDYIRDMGYTGIWLMPIMPGPSYHKYDVTDYLDVDPVYGTLDDFRAVVAGCHDRGIKLIIDLVVNHSSTRHPWFLEAAEALKKGRPDHPKVAYYNFTQEAGSNLVKLPGTNWYYEEQFAGGSMPDLNLNNPDLRGEIVQIMDFWLSDVGVDGFRLDAVTSFFTGKDPENIAFLRFLEEESERLKPGSYLVGECWKGLHAIADYYESGLESFFLFPAAQAEGYIAASIRARKPAQTYTKYLQVVQESLDEYILAPFLSNHDTGRTVGLVQGRQAPARVKFAHALLSLMGGHSFTYYGEEIGMVGAGEDPNKRLGMLWDQDEVTQTPPGVTQEEYAYPGVYAQQADPLSILNYIKKMNHQRLSMPAIARGKLAILDVTDDTCVMTREWAGQTLTIAVNFSAKEAREVTLPGGYTLLDTLDTGVTVSDAKTVGEQTILTLQPFGIAYLQHK